MASPVWYAAGDDVRAAAAAYLGGWTTGALVLLVVRDRPAVRLHAWQSCLAFGALTVLWLGAWAAAFAGLAVSAALFVGLQRVAYAVFAAALVLWGWCLWQVLTGRPGRLPWAGGWAERCAAATSPRSSPPAPPASS